VKWTARWTRDRIIFLGGLAGVGYETLVTHGERPALLVLFASMLGLPAFLKKDDKAADEEREPDDRVEPQRDPHRGG
jgi:hypothetical protein